MRKTLIFSTLTLLFFIGVNSSFAISGEDSVKQLMITEGIRKYKGNCPCPYSKMKNGRTCGKSSAYSKPRGKSPLCYATDITSKMVESYKK